MVHTHAPGQTIWANGEPYQQIGIAIPPAKIGKYAKKQNQYINSRNTVKNDEHENDS